MIFIFKEMFELANMFFKDNSIAFVSLLSIRHKDPVSYFYLGSNESTWHIVGASIYRMQEYNTYSLNFLCTIHIE